MVYGLESGFGLHLRAACDLLVSAMRWCLAEIRVTPKMMMHHLPDHLQRLLVKALLSQRSSLQGSREALGGKGGGSGRGAEQADGQGDGISRPLLANSDNA